MLLQFSHSVVLSNKMYFFLIIKRIFKLTISRYTDSFITRIDVHPIIWYMITKSQNNIDVYYLHVCQ